MKEKNWDALGANMDTFKTGLNACYYFELKSNLTNSTVRNTGENLKSKGVRKTYKKGILEKRVTFIVRM